MDFAATVQRQRVFFQTGATQSPDFRAAQLQSLSAALEGYESQLLTALQADLRKSSIQGYTTELGLVEAEIRFAQKHLRCWSAPKKRRTPWFSAPASGWVQPEPFGVALILGPWNYPVQLVLTPLVSAIAAGNCVVLKPSELAPHTAEVISTLVQNTFAPESVSVVNGGPDTAGALLRERFDKIFFTGSTRIGRAVLVAAAKNLTPVTLELGGKCPAIVCADARIEQAAKRIAWGKFINAGQTCVAPDFVLVHRSVREALMTGLKKSVHEFYGEDPARSADYGRIINAKHFERLTKYLADGKIRHGGQKEAKDLYLAPTILTGVAPDSPVMQEEIFGPILPVLEFDRLADVTALLRSRPTPLALYIFSEDRGTQTRVLAETRSGGACVNDVVSHMIGMALPFGGLGESGMGAYHGQAGFEAFSHVRTVLRRATWLDTPFRYPPPQLALTGLKRVLGFLLRR